LRTAISQLEKKKEQITALDQQIQDPEELEIAFLGAEEVATRSDFSFFSVKVIQPLCTKPGTSSINTNLHI